MERDEVTVYTFGEHLYEAMLEAIDAAERHVYFETYIWKGDRIGQRFLDALNRAADRGVAVYAVWDGFANLVVPRSFYRGLSPGCVPWSTRSSRCRGDRRPGARPPQAALRRRPGRLHRRIQHR
nr:hypothetical protein [Tessaracoccus coleopterorum]